MHSRASSSAAVRGGAACFLGEGCGGQPAEVRGSHGPGQRRQGGAASPQHGTQPACGPAAAHAAGGPPTPAVNGLGACRMQPRGRLCRLRADPPGTHSQPRATPRNGPPQALPEPPNPFRGLEGVGARAVGNAAARTARRSREQHNSQQDVPTPLRGIGRLCATAAGSWMAAPTAAGQLFQCRLRRPLRLRLRPHHRQSAPPRPPPLHRRRLHRRHTAGPPPGNRLRAWGYHGAPSARPR